MTSNVLNINYEVSLYHTNSTRAILEAYVEFLRADGPGDAVVQVEVSPNSTLVFYGHVGHVGSSPEFKPFRSIPVMTQFVKPTNGTVASLLFATVGSSGNGANGESPGSYVCVVNPISVVFADTYADTTTPPLHKRYQTQN